jgi:glycosyltransferase involved in cell wall biosynthesis
MITTPPSLVTIIIPTYNWSSVLPYSIGSALLQTFPDFEVLVIGDGCTDDSESVVKAVGDERVRWINLPANTGHQSGPNNEGLRQARGDLIAYLGHDDLWLPHHLSCMVAALAAGADLAFGITEIIGPRESFRVAAPFKLKYTPGDWVPPTGVAHHRYVTERVGGWRNYRELTVDPEVDLWQRAYDGGHKFAFVPRLTAIKFSASERPGIYRDTPHHEQAEWFERIHRDHDLEATELVRLLALAKEVRTWNETLYPQMLGDFLSETVRRLRRRLLGAVRPARQPAKGEGVDARRLLKGLRPKP